MTGRQVILQALAREKPARLPMWDLTFWPETIKRWRGEGLPEGVDLNAYFGLDPCACINDLFDPSFDLPEETLEETDEQRTYRDRYGKVLREWRRATATPSLIEPAIRTREDWERVRERLSVGAERFNNPAAEAEYLLARKRGDFLAITPAEPVWFVLELTMGFEGGLRAMLREPELVEEMVTAYTDYVLAMLERTLARGYRFDAVWFWSDLCYAGGMLFSPRVARRLALPHWQRLGEFIHGQGMRFMFHCDGDVRGLLPLLIEAGVDSIHPLEARAGNDAVALKQEYGDRICLIGNVNADVVATNDPAAIEREVAAKVGPLREAGGYIYHIDHSVPPTIALESYRHLLACVREC